MQDFSRYPYIIQINDLEETARKVINGGWPIFVVINGEYYDIDIDGNKLKEWKQYREGK